MTAKCVKCGLYWNISIYQKIPKEAIPARTVTAGFVPVKPYKKYRRITERKEITMKIKIIYKVGGMNFEAVADNIAKAYEYVKAIINANKLSFPRQEKTLSDYMELLSSIKTRKSISHENHVFKIEKME